MQQVLVYDVQSVHASRRVQSGCDGVVPPETRRRQQKEEYYLLQTSRMPDLAETGAKSDVTIGILCI